MTQIPVDKRMPVSMIDFPQDGNMYAVKDGDAIVLNSILDEYGEKSFYLVKNQTGSSIPKGTAVRFAGTVGMSGKLLIAPFIADGSVQSSFFMGVTAEAIADGADGEVIWFGKIRQINTNSFDEGDILYASTSTAGAFQKTVPQAPNNIVQIAAVITKSSTVGEIFVRPTIAPNINKIEGVKFTTPTTGDILQLQSNGLWENKQLSAFLAKGVRTQTGNFTPTLTNNGTDPFNLFQSNFSWLSAYYDLRRIITIELSGRCTIPASGGLDFSAYLDANLTGTYLTIENNGATTFEEDFILKYVITISTTSEIKIVGTLITNANSTDIVVNGIKSTFVNVNLSNNATIYVLGEFQSNSATNAIASNLITVTVL
jgi:hypothetical protein